MIFNYSLSFMRTVGCADPFRIR